MFKAAELGRSLSKREFERRLPELRARLVHAEFALKKADVPVVVIISGVDGAGKGEVVHRLNEWLDPRGLDTHSFWHETEEEREHPFYWHFWQALPARGRMSLLFGSWYTDPVIQRAYGRIKESELDNELRRIRAFEEMLTVDGTLIIKLWFHLSKKALSERLSKLEKSPETHWRVLPSDWAHHKLHDRFLKISERTVRRTDTPFAPWSIIDSMDERYRDLTAAQIILKAIQSRIGRAKSSRRSSASKPTRTQALAIARRKRVSISQPGAPNILDRVDLTPTMTWKKYDEKLAKYQGRLNRLTWAAYEMKISQVIVFEGWDAAGKGSSIRRVTAAMDPRLFRVVPISAPTEEERARHYLWRFWAKIPNDGHVAIFDRSWYGRVLVERIEGYAKPEEWMRAYDEINDFERQLWEHGIVISKFWLHISKAEQLRRFEEREQVPFKQYKITPDDWRNRRKWDEYGAAVHDMVTHNSTKHAPWTLVSGEDKRFARIQILKALCQRLEEVL